MFTARTLSLSLAFLPVALAACGLEPEPTTRTAACVVDPELGVRPPGVQGDGIETDRGSSTGIRSERIAVNGVQMNGVQMNGIQTNGVQMNGIQTNGVQMNGVQMNGVQLNLQSVHERPVAASAAMNELVALGSDGAIISGEALVGATLPALLSDGRSIALVITKFERSSSEPDIASYEIAYQGESICADGAKGMFVPGVWDEHGGRRDALTFGSATASVTFSCAGGVIAKCARWGYAPWKVGAALHQTCTRMARADYCGTGSSFTRDGTAIDMFDVPGVQAPANEAGFLFEAGWNENGATCVSRPRYGAIAANGAEVLPSCWRDLPRCASWDQARATGATIGNASRPQSRQLCE